MDLKRVFSIFLNAQSVYQVVKEPGLVKQNNQESMETKNIFPRSEATALQELQANNHKMDADGTEHQKPGRLYHAERSRKAKKRRLSIKQSLEHLLYQNVPE